MNDVLNIRLSSMSGEDFIAWAHEKNGIFSMKGAYKLRVQLHESGKQEPTSSTLDRYSGLWKLIWNSKVPPK